MKSIIKISAIVLGLIISVTTTISCSKDEDNNTNNGYIENQDFIDSSESKGIEGEINRNFTDQYGRTWNISGTVEVDLFGNDRHITYDVVLTDPDGNKFHFQGTIYFLPNGEVEIDGTLTDDDGVEIDITNDNKVVLIEFSRMLIEEKNEKLDFKISGKMIDENGNTVEMTEAHRDVLIKATKEIILGL